jgi:hypothetical protein
MTKIAAPNRCTECLSPNGFHHENCTIAVWMTKYPFAIIGARGEVRGRCQTQAEADAFARTLVSANGGTANVEVRA